MPQNYFIKPGYKINTKAKTFETASAGEYWTKERIQGSAEYQYDVYKKATDVIKKYQLKSIMDLGCGPGTKALEFIYPIQKNITFIDQPNCERIINANFPDCHFISTDLENIDVDLGKKYELIICADVIEHLHNPDAMINFIIKHLSANGYLLISTPERDILRGINCFNSPHPSHVREWNMSEFSELIKFYGFKIVEHELLPAKKINFINRLKKNLFGWIIKDKDWYSCQTILCRLT